MRDQFTSDPLQVNLPSRNIKWNLLYQTSYLILCLHVNTIVYLDVIENPVEYQKLLWNLCENRFLPSQMNGRTGTTLKNSSG